MISHRTCPAPNHLFQILDLYWRSPESGGLRYESRQLKKMICFPCLLDRQLGIQHDLTPHLSRIKSPFLRSLICTGARRNPAAWGYKSRQLKKMICFPCLLDHQLGIQHDLTPHLPRNKSPLSDP